MLKLKRLFFIFIIIQLYKFEHDLQKELKTYLNKKKETNLNEKQLNIINEKINELQDKINIKKLKSKNNKNNEYLWDKKQLSLLDSSYHEFMNDIENNLTSEIEHLCINNFKFKTNNLLKCKNQFIDLIIYSNFLSNTNTKLSSYKSILLTIRKLNSNISKDQNYKRIDNIVTDQIKFKPLSEIEKSIDEISYLIKSNIK